MLKNLPWSFRGELIYRDTGATHHNYWLETTIEIIGIYYGNN